MNNFTSNKHVVYWYTIFAVLLTFVGVSAIFRNDWFGHASFMVILGATCIGLAVCLYAMAGYAFLVHKEKHRAINHTYPNIHTQQPQIPGNAQPKFLVQDVTGTTRNGRTRNRNRHRGTASQAIPVVPGNTIPDNSQTTIPGNSQGYRPPTNAVTNPVPTGMIIFGQPFKERSKVFTQREQEHVISLAKNGVTVSDILGQLHIGNDYSKTITAIITAYKQQVENF